MAGKIAHSGTSPTEGGSSMSGTRAAAAAVVPTRARNFVCAICFVLAAGVTSVWSGVFWNLEYTQTIDGPGGTRMIDGMAPTKLKDVVANTQAVDITVARAPATLAERAAVSEEVAKDPSLWPWCGDTNGSGPNCSMWFQMPPFDADSDARAATEHTLSSDLNGWWSPLTPKELQQVTPTRGSLFENTECRNPHAMMIWDETNHHTDSKAPFFPCCAGLLHSGGGFVVKSDHRCDQSVANRLRFRRAESPAAPFLSGARLLQEIGDNRTLLFIGDSVMDQVHAAIECAARRDGCTVKSRTSHVMRASRNFKACVGTTWKMGIKSTSEVTLSCPAVPDSVEQPLANVEQNSATVTTHRIVYLHQYRPCFLSRIENKSDANVGEGIWDSVEQEYVASFEADVVVLGAIGSHFWRDELITVQKGPDDPLYEASHLLFPGELRTILRSEVSLSSRPL